MRVELTSQVMLKGQGSVTVVNSAASSNPKPCDARNAFFHELRSPQSRPRDARARWLLDQRYGHLRRPLHNLSRPTQLDRQTSCDVGVAISFKSRGALSFAHPTMAHTRARASLIVSRGSSSRWTVRISTLKLRQLHQFWLAASAGWLAAFPNDLAGPSNVATLTS